MTSSLSAYVGPTFLSVSLMITSTFLLRCKNSQCCFFPGWTYFVLFSFPWCVGILHLACLERQNKIYYAVVFLRTNSTNSFHPNFFLSRTKVPGAFSTKKNILLSILCRKFSKLENMFFHFNVSDLGMNFIPRERTWIVAKFGKNIFERL